MNIEVKILRNEHGKPAGKLADAEIHFIAGELAGLKLVGFTIWERRDGNGRRVTFPGRPLIVHGDKRNFELLRAIGNAHDGHLQWEHFCPWVGACGHRLRTAQPAGSPTISKPRCWMALRSNR